VQASGGSKLYAPIAELHLPFEKAPRYTSSGFQITKVEDLRPGARPRITFKVWDRNGPMVPGFCGLSRVCANPVPAFEPDGPTSSYFARGLSSFTIRLMGPTTPDYGQATTFSLTSGSVQVFDPSTAKSVSVPDPFLLSTLATADEYVYVFSTVVPPSTGGSWAVAIEGRRYSKYAFYDKVTDTILWPGTGETVSESPDNPIVYVNTAIGTWPPDGTPRRKPVASENCQRCHYRLNKHGARHQVEYCVFCHTPTTTDWSRRAKAGGYVDFSSTFDGIEERSNHFKLFIMRIHTGAREGVASLEAIRPGIMSSTFFDDFRFPNDLANCTLCHVGKAYLPESVPADAAPTVANENDWIMHAASTSAHSPGEGRPPIQAACLACHETGTTFAHVAAQSGSGVETCPQCHGAKGAKSTEVVHGLLPAVGTAASASFSSIVQNILVPRCATSACHATGGTPPILEASTAYSALVSAPSGQSSLLLVAPSAPDASYLVYKLRGNAGAVGGSTLTVMPTDGALAPADIAAIEAWISNGAPND
jgi:OmcA/MtrC family decaheme c-type cytochrome